MNFFANHIHLHSTGLLKGLKKLKGLIEETYRCLKHDAHPSNTLVTIDAEYNKDRYLCSVKCQLISMGPLKTPIQCRGTNTRIYKQMF